MIFSLTHYDVFVQHLTPVLPAVHIYIRTNIGCKPSQN